MRRRRVSALYLECTARQAFQVWLGVALNFGLLAWCAVWLARHSAAVDVAWPWFAASIVVALFLSDWLSGLIHWSTDTWFDETRMGRTVSIAREHHIYPSHIVGYGVRDYLGYSCWPTVLVVGPVVLVLTIGMPTGNGVFLATMVCAEVALVMVFGTYGHRLGHVRSRSKIVRLLQRCRLLITPAYHAVHHRGRHDIRYCVINGWADAVCDRVGFWRGLERVVFGVTGAVPRRNDIEWLARFKVDPSFMRDPLPSLRRLRRARVATIAQRAGE